MAVCFIIVRSVSDKCLLMDALFQYVHAEGRGIHFNPKDAFCEMPYLSVNAADILFELYDTEDDDGFGVFMEFDDYAINGIKPSAPLTERLLILQNAICISMRYSNKVEVFLEDNHPTLDEYEMYYISPTMVAETLKEAYEKEPLWSPYVPDVHLIVS